MLIYFLTGLRSQVATADEAGDSDTNLSSLPAPTLRGIGGGVGKLVTESADG
jgi:hypothetical protein